MTPKSFDPIKEILFSITARYLTVKPHGIEISPGRTPVRVIEARVLNHGGARTLYRGRRPVCRSLDGLAAVRKPDKRCASCHDSKHCTPQVRVDLLVEGKPCRLLLSFTSARNFLGYVAQLQARGHKPQAVRTRVNVTHRGSWGELRFHEVPESFPPTRRPAAPTEKS